MSEGERCEHCGSRHVCAPECVQPAAPPAQDEDAAIAEDVLADLPVMTNLCEHKKQANMRGERWCVLCGETLAIGGEPMADTRAQTPRSDGTCPCGCHAPGEKSVHCWACLSGGVAAAQESEVERLRREAHRATDDVVTALAVHVSDQEDDDLRHAYMNARDREDRAIDALADAARRIHHEAEKDRKYLCDVAEQLDEARRLHDSHCAMQKEYRPMVADGPLCTPPWKERPQ